MKLQKRIVFLLNVATSWQRSNPYKFLCIGVYRYSNAPYSERTLIRICIKAAFIWPHWSGSEKCRFWRYKFSNKIFDGCNTGIINRVLLARLHISEGWRFFRTPINRQDPNSDPPYSGSTFNNTYRKCMECWPHIRAAGKSDQWHEQDGESNPPHLLQTISHSFYLCCGSALVDPAFYINRIQAAKPMRIRILVRLCRRH